MEPRATTWLEELKTCPARCLADLPEPTSFVVKLAATDELLSLVTWEMPEPREPSSDGRLTLDSLEWKALVAGVEAERFLPEDLRTFCQRRREMPEARLDLETTLDGAVADARERALSVGQTLERLGVTLLTVSLRTTPSAGEALSDVNADADAPLEPMTSGQAVAA